MLLESPATSPGGQLYEGAGEGVRVKQYRHSYLEYSEDPFSDGETARDPDLRPLDTPIWRETLCGLDWLALRASPVYYGWGVERGNGEPVVVVPGFLASDVSLIELHAWLSRIGYRPYFSNVGRNADCPNHIASKLLQTIKQAYDETGQRVRLIGHSLGGMLSRSLALDFPEYVNLVVSMGSPFQDGARAHPSLVAATDSLRASDKLGNNIKPSCFSGRCQCNFGMNMVAPEEYTVAHYAIYSRNDGVVDWEACREEDPALNDEVNCTHLGMAFHPGVYRALAGRLRQAA